MKTFIKKLAIIVLVITCTISFTGCSTNQNGNPNDEAPTHVHTYSSKYSYDNNYHWFLATCEHNLTKDKDEHIYTNGFCECGYQCIHSYEDNYTCHDRPCVKCGIVNTATTEHSYIKGVCRCGKELFKHITLDEIPDYSGDVYVVINSNEPFFTEEEITTTSFEFYSELDSLGRCGYAFACIGTDIQPAPGEQRGDIGDVYPSGWNNKRYDSDLVDGGWIYNRSHLIGWQLTAENDNEKNLITGTRYFNVEGMLPYENMVDDYLEEYESNHVMYRVTPIYDGNNLVASGVLMEAYSVEDNGEEVQFCVYIYNVQPGITIDYATGNNWLTPN